MSAAELAAALGVLTPETQPAAPLPPAPPGAGVLARSGVADTTSPPTAGGGIASPLTETAAAERTYHPPITLESSDGLFALTVSPIKDVKMIDATGAAVRLAFAAP